MTVCEWEPCREPATHTVEITFPDQPTETWRVCRSHDRQLKMSAVRSRPAAPPRVEIPTHAHVECGQCHRPIDEPPDLPVDARNRCPECGSIVRHFGVSISETLALRDSLRARTKRAGKGGWILDTRDGDDYSRDLAAWSKRQLTVDRDRDEYREVIELFDGTHREYSPVERPPRVTLPPDRITRPSGPTAAPGWSDLHEDCESRRRLLGMDDRGSPDAHKRLRQPRWRGAAMKATTAMAAAPTANIAGVAGFA